MIYCQFAKLYVKLYISSEIVENTVGWTTTGTKYKDNSLYMCTLYMVLPLTN